MIDKPELIIDKSITVEAAKAALALEKQDRQIACGQELKNILDKYNCQLIAVPMFINDGRIGARVRIVSNS